MPDPMPGNRFRKRLAASVVGKHGEFLRALGANAELHQWLKANQPFPYFSQRFELYEEIDAKILRNEPIDYLEFGVFHGDSILKWASMMKQFILYTIFCNVFLLPWAMAQRGTALGEVGSVLSLLLKFLVVAISIVVVETVQSRLRFYRYQEPLAAGFLFAVLAIVSSQLI